ncbi:retrotransposable element ORF2 protein [Plecturocebus cupreus]
MYRKTWNQPKCPSMIDWIRKMWYIYTMEYYAAMKRNEIVSFSGVWMKLKAIILSKLTQKQKTKHCMFSPETGTESRSVQLNYNKPIIVATYEHLVGFLFVCLFLFETGSRFVTQARVQWHNCSPLQPPSPGLKLVLNSWPQAILPSQPPKVLGLQEHLEFTGPFQTCLSELLKSGYPLGPFTVGRPMHCNKVIVSLCHQEPGWSAVAQSWLTATSASQVQAILLPQPPE